MADRVARFTRLPPTSYSAARASQYTTARSRAAHSSLNSAKNQPVKRANAAAAALRRRRSTSGSRTIGKPTASSPSTSSEAACSLEAVYDA